MPIFEYCCDDCGKIFEQLITRVVCSSDSDRSGQEIIEVIRNEPHIIRYDGEPTNCPACGAVRIRRRMGTFNFKI